LIDGIGPLPLVTLIENHPIASNELIDYVTQLRLCIANHPTLTPGDEAVRAYKQRIIRLNPVGLTPVRINVPKLTFRSDEVCHHGHTMGLATPSAASHQFAPPLPVNSVNVSPANVFLDDCNILFSSF